LATAFGSQAGQTSPQTPAFRSGIDLARIDVTVIDNKTGPSGERPHGSRFHDQGKRTGAARTTSVASRRIFGLAWSDAMNAWHCSHRRTCRSIEARTSAVRRRHPPLTSSWTDGTAAGSKVPSTLFEQS